MDPIALYECLASMSCIVTQTSTGLIVGSLLFLVAAGLTLIFGVLGVINFEHGSLYMLGAYIGYSISRFTGFWPALILAPLAAGGLGALFERVFLQHDQQLQR